MRQAIEPICCRMALTFAADAQLTIRMRLRRRNSSSNTPTTWEAFSALSNPSNASIHSRRLGRASSESDSDPACELAASNCFRASFNVVFPLSSCRRSKATASPPEVRRPEKQRTKSAQSRLGPPWPERSPGPPGTWGHSDPRPGLGQSPARVSLSLTYEYWTTPPHGRSSVSRCRRTPAAITSWTRTCAVIPSAST